jgi:hypothetical protein
MQNTTAPDAPIVFKQMDAIDVCVTGIDVLDVDPGTTVLTHGAHGFAASSNNHGGSHDPAPPITCVKTVNVYG